VSKKRTGDEVGYGKPPKDTQFQKGVSGNPNGRPKKCRNFDEELIRESNSLMTINENGQRKRISKHEVVIKQLLKHAMTGSTQAQRMYLDHHRRAHERGSLMASFRTNNSGKYDKVKYLTDEELMRIILDSQKEMKEVKSKTKEWQQFPEQHQPLVDGNRQAE
jgi:hypothetical protein